MMITFEKAIQKAITRRHLWWAPHQNLRRPCSQEFVPPRPSDRVL